MTFAYTLMRNSLKLIILGLILALRLLSISQDVRAFGYGYGIYPVYYNSYGYGVYNSAGPYSYQFVPQSFWGRYYNPGLYYSTLDYSTRNSLLSYSQRNLGMTYDMISRQGIYY